MPGIATFRAINKKPHIGASSASIKDVEKAINRFANSVVAEAKKYPPKAPDQKYRRTGNLSRAWRTTRGYSSGDFYTLKIVNDVEGEDGPYASRVQGLITASMGKRQYLIFASRGWRSIETIMDEEFSKVLPEIRKSFKLRYDRS